MELRLYIPSIQKYIEIQTKYNWTYSDFCNEIISKLLLLDIQCEVDNIRCLVDNISINTTSWIEIKNWKTNKLIKGICCIVPRNCCEHNN